MRKGISSIWACETHKKRCWQTWVSWADVWCNPRYFTWMPDSEASNGLAKLQLTIVNPIGFFTLNSAWGFLRWASDGQQRSGAALKKRQQQQQQPNNKPADAFYEKIIIYICMYVYVCACFWYFSNDTFWSSMIRNDPQWFSMIIWCFQHILKIKLVTWDQHFQL